MRVFVAGATGAIDGLRTALGTGPDAVLTTYVRTRRYPISSDGWRPRRSTRRACLPKGLGE